MARSVHLSEYSEGEGPTLLLLHAFPVDSRMWLPAAKSLFERHTTARIICVDLPGFGQSPKPSIDSTMEAAAQAIHDEVLKRNLKRCIVAGVSMGGYVAMAYARLWPDEVHGLALVDTRAGADTDQARENRLNVAQKVLDEGKTDSLKSMIDTLLGETTQQRSPEIVNDVYTWIVSQKPEAIAWAQRAMAERPDSTEMLSQLECPVSIIVGAEDVLSPVAVAQEMADAVKSDVVVIPEAGHLSPLENPEPVADELFRLVQQIDKKGPAFL